MPAQRKAPRLWLRPARRDRHGRIIRQSSWIVLDGGRHHATGCAAGETERAQLALADYIARKYRPARAERPLSEIPVADVLSVFLDDSDQIGMRKFRERIGRLNDFFGNMTLDRIGTASCKDYARARGALFVERGGQELVQAGGGARRDLEDLRAAINHHAARGLHREIVRVWLPPKGAARDRWLTRHEAAKLIRACWRARETQRRHRGPDKGRNLPTDKRPLRHVARFILIGLYTGSRAGAIAAAAPVQSEGRSFVDLDSGIFYRRRVGARASSKRQPPAPLPPRLLAHLRRWQRLGIARECFVEFNGRPVQSVKTGFASGVRRAGIAHATPHTLRHTAVTWMLQNGVAPWMVGGFVGMSEKMVIEQYGHHHPAYMQEAVRGVAAKPNRNEALVVSLADAASLRRMSRKS